jgi:LacI family transcriptional regulator
MRNPGILLDMAQDATAILSMSVMQGVGIIEEAQLRGLKVPDDISVVGYNDIANAWLCNPPLTTVDSMGVQKGRVAARFVIENKLSSQELINPELIIRSSTGPAFRSDIN